MGKQIFVDLDGVLGDFVHAALQAHREPISGPSLPEIDDVAIITAARSAWPDEHPFKQLELVLGVTTAQFWDTILGKGVDFWTNMRPFPWTTYLWEQLNAIPDTGVAILTSPPRGHAAGVGAHGKLDWVCKHLGEDAAYQTIVCPAPYKHMIVHKHAILIDDLDSTVDRVNACNGGRAIRFPSLQFDGKHPTQQDIDDVIKQVAACVAVS